MPASLDIFAKPNGRRIAVVGGGVSGQATAKLLVHLGADVLVSDSGTRENASPQLLALPVRFEFGSHKAVAKEEGVIMSPGVPHQAVEHAKHLPRMGELELASLHVKKRPVAAITGTNGKTTTTSLLGHLVGEEPVFVGGNIGWPWAAHALDQLQGGTPPARYVLEVSSYQAELLAEFSPDVGVYLNLTPDHLDRYPSLMAYGAAKAQLFARQSPAQTAVLNADDPMIQTLGRSLRSRIVWFSLDRKLGEQDAWLESPSVAVARGERFVLDRGVLRGKHNRQNQLAAIAAAQLLGVSSIQIQDRLNSFAGVEHRIERVAEVAGVEYFNDSKATNDDAAAKAIEAFSEGGTSRRLVWLAGGRDKKGGYEAVRHAARGRVAHAIVFGEAAPLIAEAMKDIAKVEHVADLTAAVAAAAQRAEPGDVVLLSPACSSFDQFKNYEERGRKFKTLVNALQGVRS